MQKKDSKKFSLMMTVYNLDGLVKRAVNSILKQTFDDFELLVLDDGSSDDTWKVLNSIVDSRLRLFREEENKGISFGRNRLMEEAVGEWFYFVDGDDYVSPNFLEEINKRIEDHPDVDCFFVDIYDEEGGEIRRNFYLEEKELSSPYEILRNLLLCTQSQVVKRELFEGVEWPIGRYYEDVGTIYKLLPKINKAYSVGEAFYFHCAREDSIVHSRGRKPDMDLVELTWEQWKAIKPYISPRAAKKQLGAFRMACLWVTLNYRRDAQTELAFQLHEHMKTTKDTYDNFFLKGLNF